MVLGLLLGCGPRDGESAGQGGGEAGGREPVVEPGEAPTPPAGEPVAPEGGSEGEGLSGVEDVPRAEVVPVEPAREKVEWTLAHAGFAANLPPDTDVYADGRKLGWLKNAFQLLDGTGKLEVLREELEEDDPRRHLMTLCEAVLPALMSDEGFVAFRGGAAAMEAVVEISDEVNRVTGHELAQLLAGGDIFALIGDGFGTSAMVELPKWLLGNAGKVDEAEKRLAIYLGGKLDGEQRARAMAEMVRFLEERAAETPGLQAVAWERGEVRWRGVEIELGELEVLKDSEPPVGTEEEDWKTMQTALTGRRVVMGCAEVGDYLVLAAGLGREALIFADSPEASLAATKPFEFFKQFDAVALRATSWMHERIVSGVRDWNSSLSFFEGIEEALEDDDTLRHGPAMAEAVKELNSRYRKLRSGEATPYLAAVLAEEGLRMESSGGWTGQGLDLERATRFAPKFREVGERWFLRAAWQGREEHAQEGAALAKAAKRLVRLISEEAMDKAMESNQEEGELEEVEKLTRWKRILVNGLDELWDGYESHFAKAFGRESVLVMDLEGKMVPAVGVDEELLEKGRIPRAALMRPVLKREALSESWTIWNRALTNLFGIMAEASDQPIPFPDTMTAEKNDLRTYFFPMPFGTDDFLPSVSVSDELFVLGTSKALSESLYEAAGAAGDGEGPAGLQVEMNTKVLWPFLEVWLEIYEARLEAAAAEEAEWEAGEGAIPLEEDPAEGVQGVEMDEDVADNLRKLLEDEDIPEDVKEQLRETLREVEALEQSEEEPAEPHPAGEEEAEAPEGEEADEGPVELKVEIEGLEVDELEMLDEDDLLMLENFEDFEEESWLGPGGWKKLVPEVKGLRGLLQRLRKVEGISYHRRLEDGRPRATLRVRLGAP